MKQTFLKRFLLVLLAMFLILSPVCMATEDVVEASYEVISSDVYEYSTTEDITIDSIVNGNVFVFGTDVTITSEVIGDVFAFGSTVTFTDTAYIHGNIFVYASDFYMDGICYDIYAIADEFTLEENAIVARDIRILSNTININGQVNKNAYLYVSELNFPDNASELISGNLTYMSTSEIDIADGIVVGNIEFSQVIIEETSWTSYITDCLSTLLYALVIVLLTIWLAPNFKEKIGPIIKEKSLKAFGVGVLTTLVIVFGAIALATITGGLLANVAILLIALLAIALIISKTVFSMACAKWIEQKCNKESIPMFIGISLVVMLVIYLLEFISIIGIIVSFITIMIGLGIIVLSILPKRKNKEDKNSKNENVENSSTDENNKE